MYRKTLVALVVLAVTAFSATADDIVPPPWERGAEGTTVQVWEFNSPDNPALPDLVGNDFGDPFAIIIGSEPGTNQLDPLWLPDHENHTGVWRTEGYVALWLPNAPLPREWKYIWLQITYTAGNDYSPLILTEPSYATMELVNSQDAGGGYKHDTYGIIIEQNPAAEVITILPAFCALYVDEIVVDTWCVPEPAAVALISLGGVFLLRRRRR